MAQLVESLTSAQVMISQFVGSSPTLGSMLTARSLEPASNSVSPSLSAPSLLTHCLSLTHTHKYLLKNNNAKKLRKSHISLTVTGPGAC